MTLEPVIDADRPAVKVFTQEHWHAPHICMRGKLYYPHEADGFLVRREGEIVGLVTFRDDGDEMQVLTLNRTEQGAGIGSKLMLRAIEEARQRGSTRVWLTTTNDNLKSIGFYQRLGFRLAAIYTGSVDEARRTIKPEVPEFGCDGLPIHDEIELELVLKPYIGD